MPGALNRVGMDLISIIQTWPEKHIEFNFKIQTHPNEFRARLNLWTC